MRLLNSVLSILLLASGLSTNAYAITPQEILDGSVLLPQSMNFRARFDDRYRIGDEWGKKPVTEEDLASDEGFRRMAMATARVRTGGTGFYIGEYNGKLVLATNHHVCESAWQCKGNGTVNFPLLGFSANVTEFYGSWPEIDLALMAIEVPGDAKATEMLNAVASPFAYDAVLHRGQPLVTIGFGVANNPGRVMVGNRDADCRVFSEDGEYRLMADPDDLNPAPYKAWSFANGCDVSHGDSGSAMMDRESGQVVGIIWTGRIPKSAKVQSSAYLNELLSKPSEDIWKELSYAVPAAKMKEYLSEQLRNGSIEEAHRETIRQVLQ